MLPKAQAVEVNFEALAEKMQRRKERLLTGGVAPAAEDRMVKGARGQGDSPAKAAGRKAPKLPPNR